MNAFSNRSALILSLGVILLSACGGGGGGGGGTVAQPTTAVLTMSAAATGSLPANAIVNAYKVMVTLPDGVTVKASPDEANPGVLVPDPGVIAASGSAAGSVITGVYTAANSTNPATVEIIIANANGLAAGEFGTVTCDIAAGYNPAPSDFPQPGFEAAGLITAPTNSSVDLTGQMALTVAVDVN